MNSVLKTVFSLAKYHNGAFKSPKQAAFIQSYLAKNPRLEGDKIAFSSVFWCVETDDVGITRITKEVQGKHRSRSSVKLTVYVHWERLSDGQWAIKQPAIMQAKLERTRFAIRERNVRKLESIQLDITKQYLMETMAGFSELAVKLVLDGITKQSIFEMIGTGEYPKLSRIQVMIDKRK